MLVAPRGLVSAYLVCIARTHAKRIVQYDHKRAGLGKLIVRSMSNEGKAAQESVESGCVQSLRVTLHASEDQNATLCNHCGEHLHCPLGPLKRQNKAKSLCLIKLSQSRFLQQSCMRMRLHWLSSRSQGPLSALSSPYTSALQLSYKEHGIQGHQSPGSSALSGDSKK